MSSPAAAEKALRMRAGTAAPAAQPPGETAVADAQEARATTLREAVEDARDESLDFEPALGGFDSEESESSVPLWLGGAESGERARLSRFAARAAALRGKDDPKLQRLLTVVGELLRDGFNPIIYCRYIATADYLAAELAQSFKREAGLLVLSVTGERSEEEREVLVGELEQSPRRILVATDCLSEGINLQRGFDSVVHYDLPWNPNRLEQREGRVDRYGQQRPTVRTTLLYGQDNPIDEAVMKVLLRKAVRIHKTLGISVPLPVDSGTVVEALIETLFQPAAEQLALFDTARQMTLLDAAEEVRELETAWDRVIEREQASRTRFAQRRIKPEEVARELEESDAVLGAAAAVEDFVAAACARLGASLVKDAGKRQKDDGKRKKDADGQLMQIMLYDQAYVLSLATLPEPVRERLQSAAAAAFVPHPAPVLDRNHPLVVGLADYLMETALAPDEATPVAARSGVIRSRAVTRRTRLLLLRVRMLIKSRKRSDGAGSAPLLAEEVVVAGFSGQAAAAAWLDQSAALALLEHAEPAANLSHDERLIALQAARNELPALSAELDRIAGERAERLRESHLRVRAQTGGGAVRVRPAGPPDVLGLYVLLPVV